MLYRVSTVGLVLACFLAGNAFAQGESGKDSLNIEVATYYSLYYENFRNENYVDALPDLRWILGNAPGFPRNKDTNFDRAVDLYEALAEQAADDSTKRVRLDSALAMFDRAVPAIQSLDGEIDEFEWARNKGHFIQKHLDLLDDRKGEAVEAYRKAYDIDPARIDVYYLDVILSDDYSNAGVGAALDFLRELQETRGDEEGIKNLVRKYFAVVPPEEQIEFLEEQLAEEPKNVEIVKQLFELYEDEGEIGNLMELAPRMLELEPTAEVLRLLMRLYLEDGDFSMAIEIFGRMKDLSGTELFAQDFHNAGIALQEQEKFGAAEDHYHQALFVDPEYKPAQKAIPDLYATAVAKCGVKDREEAAVFWLIADAYSRAGDGAGAARMHSAFPTAEDIFYVKKWTEGGTTTAIYYCRGLTIVGSTMVRQR